MKSQKYAPNELRYCEYCGKSNKETKVYWYSKHNRTLCRKHEAQLSRNGSFIDNTHYDINEYIIKDDYAEIVLKDRNYNIVGYAKIDIEDIEKCKKYKWFLGKQKAPNISYVLTKDKSTRKNIRLHRYILNYNGNLFPDHINKDPLDNRKSNLRITTRSDNNSNRSFSNISKVGELYIARLSRNYVKYYFGSYRTKEEAENIIYEAKSLYEKDPNKFFKKYENNKAGVKHE